MNAVLENNEYEIFRQMNVLQNHMSDDNSYFLSMTNDMRSIES